MLDGTDNTAFDAIMRDLALAFDRPHDVERVRVFWEALKHVALGEVRARAIAWRKSGKRFPTPRDLMPEKVAAPVKHTSCEPADVVERAEKLSSWAKAANVILFHVAYCDPRRRCVPLGEELRYRCLAAKRDLVGAAEQDARAGQPWDEREFNVTCRQAFEQILGLTGVPMPTDDEATCEGLMLEVPA